MALTLILYSLDTDKNIKTSGSNPNSNTASPVKVEDEAEKKKREEEYLKKLEEEKKKQEEV